MDIKGSRTEANLLAAFAGESQARNRYTYFASIARKAGYEHIAAIFEETAANEQAHAKLFLRRAGKLDHDLPAALLEAACGENEEWTVLYPEFAKVAREEGFEPIAKLFERIAAIEAEHEARYRALLEQVKTETVFQRPKTVRWKCRVCGHIHEGPEAPIACPTCAHPRAFFEAIE